MSSAFSSLVATDVSEEDKEEDGEVEDGGDIDSSCAVIYVVMNRCHCRRSSQELAGGLKSRT